MSGKINAIDQLRLSLNILNRADVLKIHTATLDVIESIGVRFPSQKALNILEAHGATVERSPNRISILIPAARVVSTA